MNITPRLATAIKISFWIAIASILIGLSFQLFWGQGEETHLRDEVNSFIRYFYDSFWVISNLSFWALAGFLCKDYKSAFLAVITSFAIYFLNEYNVLPAAYEGVASDGAILIVLLIGIIPYLVFGFVHFRSLKALRLILVWPILWGIDSSLQMDFFSLGSDFDVLLDRIELFFSYQYINPETGNTVYTGINLWTWFSQCIFLIIRVSIFAWFYDLVNRSESIVGSLKHCFYSTYNDALTYSIVFWSFKFILFIAALSLVGTFQFYLMNDFSPFYIVLTATLKFLGIFFLSTVFRNYLVTFFVERGSWPSTHYLLLNLPLLNVIGWLYSLWRFDENRLKLNGNPLVERVYQLKEEYIAKNMSSGWKLVFLIINIGLLIRNLSHAWAYSSFDIVHVLIAIGSFLVVCLYLYVAEAFVPILVFIGLIVLVGLFTSIQPLLEAYTIFLFINLIIFYGLFHFQTLNLTPSEPEHVSSPHQTFNA